MSERILNIYYAVLVGGQHCLLSGYLSGVGTRNGKSYQGHIGKKLPLLRALVIDIRNYICVHVGYSVALRASLLRAFSLSLRSLRVG